MRSQRQSIAADRACGGSGRIATFALLASVLTAPLASLVASAQAEPVQTSYVEAELLAEAKSIAPGSEFWVGLRLKAEPGWHTYWRNPGDSGLATKIHWTLPEGFEAGEIQWPHPERIEALPYVSFGYDGEVVLLTRITSPASLADGATVSLAADASWTACRDDRCVPGRAEVTLSLPVRAGEPVPNGFTRGYFDGARRAMPAATEAWTAIAASDGQHVVFTLTPRGEHADPGNVNVFEVDEGIVDHGVRARTLRRDGKVHVVVKADESASATGADLDAVLVAAASWDAAGRIKALPVSVAIERVADGALSDIVQASASSEPQASASASGEPQASAATAVATRVPGGIGLALALVFAFAGGLILNLMPCVFPVLSLKVVRFVRHAHGHAAEARLHGWAFAAGVLTFFWALAGVLIVLRAGGEQLGWGFQLQSPAFVAVMCLLLFVLGLNMVGVFEVGSSLVSLTGRADAGEGYFGSFASGALATILATPCTAPFMGSALGWAAAQSSLSALLVFTALGVGMASPYVLLAHVPALLSRLPRSGRWMETFKEAMSFPLFATVVWLVWVFGQQVGNGGVARLLAALVLAAMACWVLGRWGSVATATLPRRVAMLVALAFVVASIAVAVDGAGTRPTDAVASGSAPWPSKNGARWQAYDAAAVDALRAQRKAVFIDFTAAWCLTCQVNERVAFTESVWRRFEDLGVVTMKADWTHRDEHIAAALASFGRDGVPLYVLYDTTPDSPPTILPQILTPGIVLEALDELS